MNRYLLVAVGILVATSPGLRGAQAITERIAFDVTSVKPNPDTQRRAIAFVPASGGVLFTHHSVLALIYYAYGLKTSYELTGVPDWARKEHFDIRANPPAGIASDFVPRMMQTLLVDRFKLRAHREMREQGIYSLTPSRPDAKPGPDLKPSKHDCAAFFATGATLGSSDVPRDEDGRVACGTTVHVLSLTELKIELLGVSSAELVSRLEAWGGLGRPLVDRMQLTGTWNATLRFSRSPTGTSLADSDAPVFETALRDQLGLKLEPGRESRPVLVIDSVDRPSAD